LGNGEKKVQNHLRGKNMVTRLVDVMAQKHPHRYGEKQKVNHLLILRAHLRRIQGVVKIRFYFHIGWKGPPRMEGEGKSTQ